MQHDDQREAALCTRFLEAMGQAKQDVRDPVGRGRTLTADCVIQFGRTPVLLKIREGKVTECLRQLPLLCARSFTIRGSVEAWEALWQAFPAPGWHDLFALAKRGEMSVEGDTQQFMAHLQFIKDLIAFPRSAA